MIRWAPLSRVDVAAQYVTHLEKRVESLATGWASMQAATDILTREEFGKTYQRNARGIERAFNRKITSVKNKLRRARELYAIAIMEAKASE